MQTAVSFVLDGQLRTIDFRSSYCPTTTVLQYLRSLPDHRGVKEGCAEGDCGACTVVLGEPCADGTVRYRAVDACLVFLPMLHGKHLVTIENLATASGLHPVQQAMVDCHGSQCGFCTPGFIMSMFALFKNQSNPTPAQIEAALTGNLCRCTGYKPIVAATARACVYGGIDHLTAQEHGIVALLRQLPDTSLSIRTDRQEFFRPRTLQEALLFKQQHPDAIVICGATDVALRVTKRHELLTVLLALSGVGEFQDIQDRHTFLTIGAAVPLSDVMPVVAEPFPALYGMLQVFGSLQIRNLATLGGNLCTASPIGDTLPVLLAYGARVVLASLNGVREVPLDTFFVGYRQTACRPDELLSAVILPKPVHGSLVRSYKVSKRKDLDISTLSGGFRLDLAADGRVEAVVLAYGGMAERVKRATHTEAFLRGKAWSRQTVEAALPIIDQEFTPIADVRSGAEFRRIAARNLLLKFWNDTQHERQDGGME
jgi:xanthine dehydrogenase small subunit